MTNIFKNCKFVNDILREYSLPTGEIQFISLTWQMVGYQQLNSDELKKKSQWSMFKQCDAFEQEVKQHVF
ncbi:hypothetical protein [uncultured Desulfuromusa sp.]|uniref:hypothetical protein n=1 Tax=uncultured Desulfuromusa sp. TaxID=219183 RepID=UPI002AA69F80|nr:hypothetical protein [uncultured Desulfuromusa sp.]